jgi:replication factor A1
MLVEVQQQHNAKMKISEITPGQGNIDITAEVVSIDEPRQFEKYGRQLRVTNATIKDDTGEIKLTLWNDDIDRIKPNQTVHISGGYCNEFQGNKQLTTGKMGKLEVLGGETPAEPAEVPTEAPAEVPAEAPEVEETSPIPEEVIPEETVTPEETSEESLI